MEKIPMVETDHYGESGKFRDADGNIWPYCHTGPHICVLPICSGEMPRVGLIDEFKKVLGASRLKIPSDYRRGRPDNQETAMAILAAKTGILPSEVLHLVQTDILIPAWPVNIEYNTTVWFAWVRRPCGDKTVWLDMEDIANLLSPARTGLDNPTSHVLDWVWRTVERGEGFLPGEP